MSFINTLKSIFGFGKTGSSNKGDRFLNCEDCHKRFVFDVGEQRFFKEKGFSDPKRCPVCRKKVKSHIRKKFRKFRPKRNNRRFSLVDGRSPYADER